MKSNVFCKDGDLGNYSLTLHAQQRMDMRGISPSCVSQALSYGRKIHVRGAVIYAIGRKEVAQCSSLGIDLTGMDGLQVVCSNNGAVMTVYRNRDFRGLRPKRRRMH